MIDWKSETIYDDQIKMTIGNISNVTNEFLQMEYIHKIIIIEIDGSPSIENFLQRIRITSSILSDIDAHKNSIYIVRIPYLLSEIRRKNVIYSGMPFEYTNSYYNEHTSLMFKCYCVLRTELSDVKKKYKKNRRTRSGKLYRSRFKEIQSQMKSIPVVSIEKIKREQRIFSIIFNGK